MVVRYMGSGPSPRISASSSDGLRVRPANPGGHLRQGPRCRNAAYWYSRSMESDARRRKSNRRSHSHGLAPPSQIPATNQLRIGLFTDSYVPTINGATRAVQNLREGIEALGHSSYVIAPQTPGYADTEPRVLRVPSLPVGAIGNRLMLPSRAVVSHLRRLNLDLVHSHGPLSAGLIADHFATLADIPHVHTVHTNFPSLVREYKVASLLAATIGSLAYPTYYRIVRKPPYWYHPIRECPWPGFNSKTIWRLILLFSAHADAVIAPSGMMATRLREHGLKTPIYSIPNSASRHPPAEQDRAAVKVWLSTYPRDAYVRLLYVGRISPEKRVGKVVEALARIDPAIPIVFLVVGEGICEPRIRRMTQRLGLADRVLFAGRREEGYVAAAMEEADFLVLPSYRFDTQPLTVVEATLSHLPVLYCDDWLREGLSSGNALLVEPTITGLNEGILALVLDPDRLKRMAYLSGEASREFSVEAVAARTVEVYRKAIKSKFRSRARVEFEGL